MLLLLAGIVVLAVAGVSLQRIGWDEAVAWIALAATGLPPFVKTS